MARTPNTWGYFEQPKGCEKHLRDRGRRRHGACDQHNLARSHLSKTNLALSLIARTYFARVPLVYDLGIRSPDATRSLLSCPIKGLDRIMFVSFNKFCETVLWRDIIGDTSTRCRPPPSPVLPLTALAATRGWCPWPESISTNAANSQKPTTWLPFHRLGFGSDWWAV